MLQEKVIRDSSKRRGWLLLASLLFGAAIVMLYFLLVAANRDLVIAYAVWRFGQSANDFTPPLLVLTAFPLFLIPTIAGAYCADRIKTLCPSCGGDISTNAHKVLVTRCCPVCGHRIVAGGKTRSAAVYKRYLAIHSAAFLKYWFWAWPSFGLLTFAIRLIDHTALQQCPQSYFLAPLIGTSAAGWAWLRTFDSRYIPPLIASIVLLVIGGNIFWQSM